MLAQRKSARPLQARETAEIENGKAVMTAACSCRIEPACGWRFQASQWSSSNWIEVVQLSWRRRGDPLTMTQDQPWSRTIRAECGVKMPGP